jgi:hypothetical protein
MRALEPDDRLFDEPASWRRIHSDHAVTNETLC